MTRQLTRQEAREHGRKLANERGAQTMLESPIPGLWLWYDTEGLTNADFDRWERQGRRYEFIDPEGV